MQPNSSLDPMEAKAIQELALSHAMASQILAQAAFFAHTILGPARMKAPRSWAHETLAKVLDEVELSLLECKGRA